MTTKILSTYAAFGYTLSPSYSELDITATGTVVGYGVSSDHFAILRNGGTIRATATKGQGVELTAGGVVINQAGAYIGGYNGVTSFAPVAVDNYGTIRALSNAIYGGAGGSVVNGSYTSEGATIAGGAIVLTGASGAVSNFGTITALVELTAGGTVTNGGGWETPSP